MFGSIAGAESQVLAFDDSMQVRVVMTEAPHGTAPALEGKNIANPMAMILAGAAALLDFGQPQADRASRAIYESVFEAIYDNVKTADLGGHATTSGFTGEVVARVRTKIDIWASL